MTEGSSSPSCISCHCPHPHPPSLSTEPPQSNWLRPGPAGSSMNSGLPPPRPLPSHPANPAPSGQESKSRSQGPSLNPRETPTGWGHARPGLFQALGAQGRGITQELSTRCLNRGFGGSAWREEIASSTGVGRHEAGADNERAHSLVGGGGHHSSGSVSLGV